MTECGLARGTGKLRRYKSGGRQCGANETWWPVKNACSALIQKSCNQKFAFLFQFINYFSVEMRYRPVSKPHKARGEYCDGFRMLGCVNFT